MGSHSAGRNKLDEMRGVTKERIGGAKGDDSMRREGKREQAGANLRQARKKLMDAVRGR